MRFLVVIGLFELVFTSSLLAQDTNAMSNITLTHCQTFFHEEYHFPAKLEEPEKDLLVFQKLQELWKDKAKDFVVYGRVTEDSPFTWRVFPIKTANSSFLQQISILFATLCTPPQNGKLIFFKPSLSFQDPLTSHEKSTDAFCNPEVIKKQEIKEGSSTRVLFNYAPLLKGAPHFLIVPKAHYERLEDVNSSAYSELISSAKKVIDYLKTLKDKEKKPLFNHLHLFHKSGKSAGQTVAHFHLHLVATSGDKQDITGGCKVLMNIALQKLSLFFNKLSSEELKKEVSHYKGKF